MSASSIFDNALALGKADLIVAAAPAVITFLQNFPAALGNPVAMIAQIDLLRSSLTAAVPNLAQTEVSQIDNSFISALQGVLFTAKATVAAAATAGAPVAPVSTAAG